MTSTVELLPTDGTFDLWLIDNRPGPGHTTLAEPRDVLMQSGNVRRGLGRAHALGGPGASAFAGFFPDRAFVVRSGQSPLDSFVLTGPQHALRSSPRRQVRFLDDETRRAVSIPRPRPPERPISRSLSPKAGGSSWTRRSMATEGRAGRVTWRATTSPSIRSTSPPCLRAIPCSWRRPIPRWLRLKTRI